MVFLFKYNQSKIKHGFADAKHFPSDENCKDVDIFMKYIFVKNALIALYAVLLQNV